MNCSNVASRRGARVGTMLLSFSSLSSLSSSYTLASMLKVHLRATSKLLLRRSTVSTSWTSSTSSSATSIASLLGESFIRPLLSGFRASFSARSSQNGRDLAMSLRPLAGVDAGARDGVPTASSTFSALSSSLANAAVPGVLGLGMMPLSALLARAGLQPGCRLGSRDSCGGARVDSSDSNCPMDAFRLRSLRFEVAVFAFDAMRLWLCAPHGEKLP